MQSPANLSVALNKRLIPGYCQSSNHFQTTHNTTFTYEPSELDPVDKTHFRKADAETEYQEKRAFLANIQKTETPKQPQQPKK
ncbi:hypothetical protein P9112_011985 [Eukaryota sp. TZLM1-RC]